MLTFCVIVCSLRIHIERAFGQLVRRWGILWRPIETRLPACTVILEACAKLHNFCVTAWMRDHGGSADGYEESMPAPYNISHMEQLPGDADIVERLGNDEVREGSRTVYGAIREREMRAMYSRGLSSETLG